MTTQKETQWSKLLLIGASPLIAILLSANSWLALEGRAEVRVLQDQVSHIKELLLSDRARTQIRLDDHDQRLRALEKGE